MGATFPQHFIPFSQNSIVEIQHRFWWWGLEILLKSELCAELSHIKLGEETSDGKEPFLFSKLINKVSIIIIINKLLDYCASLCAEAWRFPL